MFGDDLFSVFNAPPSNIFETSVNTPIEINHPDLIENITLVESNSKRSNENCSDNDNVPKKLKIQEKLTDDLNLTELMPRIQVHKLETLEICTHEVAVPPGIEYVPLVTRSSTSKAAKEYPFILDPFQKEALLCLDNNQSVLVSAHTSAGKTVVAEYAVAMSLRDKQRVIYTTPIKALSNQKYRELFEEFQDVGLMTGDITINPTASCLVMTTEILRSMLYRGSEVMREVGWVIFDEIHYMRDKDRGVVWEETIILLPDNVHHVFLSATIPNARQFAEWIAFLHKQPCHVVYTDYRPTPLQHYIFPAGGDGIHLVVDEQGAFREDNFALAMNVLRDSGDSSKGDKWGRKGGFKGETNCFKIIKMIMDKNFAPVIVFSFSRKECEEYARNMSKLDFNTDEEKKMVHNVFNNAIDSLTDEDKQLPQVACLLPLLQKGIGIHHSGLLPLLKETVEILFSEGLIKTLFATETFAMGLNMPAKTVLFTSARKFDGKVNRWLSSGEYIQMSGRAGRRGLDEKGIVILMVDEKLSPNIGKNILKGQPDPLNSAFHLTYNMVLNLMRVEEINPEYMLERSFFQFQNYASIPALIDKIKSLEEVHNKIYIEEEDKVKSYFKIRQQLEKLKNDGVSFMQKPNYILPFLQPGRLVQVANEELEFGWGVVINFRRKANQNKTTVLLEDPQYIVDILLHLSKESAKFTNANDIKPSPKNERGEMQVVPVRLENVVQFSSVRVYMPKDIVSLDARMSVLASVQAVEKRFPLGVPLLDPLEDIGIKDKNFTEIIKRTLMLEERLFKHEMHNDPNLKPIFTRYQEKQKILTELQDLKIELKKKKSLLQMDELRRRKRVLRRLGYATVADVIETKGRVACEISSADELVVTEMIFNGAFKDITAEDACAILSCFAYGEKQTEFPNLSDSLSDLLRQMKETVKRIAMISNEAKLDIIEEDYLAQFTPSMMNVVHTWCLGGSFSHICKMTTIYEGSIIRCMRRLEEMLRQMCQAAKTIGNTDLENKFAEGIKLIKRDIVFAASLYL